MNMANLEFIRCFSSPIKSGITLSYYMKTGLQTTVLGRVVTSTLVEWLPPATLLRKNRFGHLKLVSGHSWALHLMREPFQHNEFLKRLSNILRDERLFLEFARKPKPGSFEAMLAGMALQQQQRLVG